MMVFRQHGNVGGHSHWRLVSNQTAKATMEYAHHTCAYQCGWHVHEVIDAAYFYVW